MEDNLITNSEDVYSNSQQSEVILYEDNNNTSIYNTLYSIYIVTSTLTFFIIAICMYKILKNSLSIRK